MREDKNVPESEQQEPEAHNPFENLQALEGVEYVSVSEDGVMDDDMFAILSEEEQQAPEVHNPFENLQAVEGAVSILGRHDGVMDDDLLDITIGRSGYQGE